MIQDLRAAHGLSLEDVAATADLPAPRLTAIETGEADPTLSELRAIATALDVELARVLGPALQSVHSTAGATIPSARGTHHFGKTRGNAEHLLRTPREVRKVVEQATALAAEPAAARLGDVRQDLLALIELLDTYALGEYRSVPWESMVLVAAAILYFVSPEDIVPDYLEEGYIDDAAVIAFATEMVGPDLDVFLDDERA